MFLNLRNIVIVFARRFYSTNRLDVSFVDSCAIKTGFDVETSRYNFQLKSFLRRNQFNEAHQLFDKMPRKNTCSVNLLMSCCIKGGNLVYARELFDNMVVRSTVSWTILIGGYAQNKQPREAFHLYIEMFREGMKPDHITIATLLSGSDETITVNEVGEIHAHITRLGFGHDLAVSNSLLDSYCKSRSVNLALRLFLDMTERDIITFNTMVTGFSKECLSEQAMCLFSDMQHHGFRPSDFTYAAVLRACAGLDCTAYGERVHGLVTKANFVSDIFVANALLDFYSKHDCVEEMRRLFEEMPAKDGVSYNILITSYLWSGKQKEFICLFQELQSTMFDRRNFPFATMLSVASNAKYLEMGRQIHAQAFLTNACEDILVGNSLVDMYAKCGRFNEANIIFRKLARKSPVVWTAIISACVQQGLNDDALNMYSEMHRDNVCGDQATFASTLKATANLALLSVGKQLHSSIIRSGFISTVFCGCALLDMYAKCGSLRDAVEVFKNMPERNAFSWNAMISAYAQNGDVMAALSSFEEMVESGTQPDHVSFLGVLTACSHSGQVNEAQRYFDSMIHTYQLAPKKEHYASLVDVLCRRGKFEEAEAVMSQMPQEPDEIMWSSILNSCRIHKNKEFAKRAADALFNLDMIRDAAPYITMGNIYSEAGDWENMAEVKKAMRVRGVRKVAAYSWVEIQRKVHVFSANDTTHPLNLEIRKKVNELLEQMEEKGYKPDLSCALQNVDDKSKAESLKYHSERMAIAFALMSTPEGSPILVVKNLRACVDCHAAIKVISLIVQREITVRDCSRFHHFKQGVCSCGDFW